MTFTRRHINLRFQLGQGDFGEAGADTIEFEGLRVSVSVTKAGGNTMASANIRAFGMPLPVMNQLAILGKPLTGVRANFVTVSVFDDGGAPVEIFTGAINEAWIDGKNAPQISFVLSAFDGLVEAVKPAAPTSYKGAVDLAVVADSIARQMGRTLENNGVSVIVKDQYLHGSLLDQLQEIARAGNFNCDIDGGVVAIWPAGGARGGQVPTLSATTGLIGYPAISDGGVETMSLFNPLVQVGGKVNIQSEFERANGEWTISGVVHDLESETPGGKWFSQISGRIFDFEEPGL